MTASGISLKTDNKDITVSSYCLFRLTINIKGKCNQETHHKLLIRVEMKALGENI